MFRKIVILLLPAILSAGCIREDMKDCAGGLRLRFRYTHNVQGKDLLAERVRDIRVYVFDQNTGALAHIIRPTSQDIANGYVDTDIPDGIYTVSAWGGGGEDLMLEGYLDGRMTDTYTQSYTTPVIIGQTTPDNFRMMLACDPVARNITGDVTPRAVDFDDLFFAAAANIEARKGTRQTVDLDFIKNTCVLKISVTGLEYLASYTPAGRGSSRAPGAGQPLEVFVTACNGVYGHDNRIDAYAPRVRYEPPCRMLTPTRMEVDIKVLRLEIARHTADPVLLYVRDAAAGMDMVWPLDVLDAIVKAKDAQGNLLYQTQEDIDREDEFPIAISILSDLSVSVTVNGFEVVEPGADIGRP